MATPTPAECSICELHAEAVFRVEGMDCSEEVAILERRLKPMNGLETLTADLIGQRLHVKYDAAKLSTAAMVDAVGQTGMRMWLEHEESVAASDVGRRWSLVVACSVLVATGLVSMLLGLESLAPVWFTAAAVVGGVYPALRAARALRTRTVDINVLMVIAVAGALALGQWLEAASVVLLFALAQWLEVRTMDRARQAIRALMDLSPREALLRGPEGDRRVGVEDVRVGDEITLRPGDKIPLDGVITVGRSDVNEAPLTGESVPVDKSAGDDVYAGTINGRGSLAVKVTRLVRDTRLAKVIHLVEVAQANRAPVQSFVDRFARWYTPMVIAVAVVVAATPLLFGVSAWTTWMYRSLVLLVIACPCALVISTPVSIVAALAAAARHGVLVKGGAHLERLAGVRVVAFDKTGTLTRGTFEVTDAVAVPPVSSLEVLHLAASAESRSEHPIARAIVEHAHRQGLELDPAAHVLATPGMGAEAEVAGRKVVVGSEAFFANRGIDVGSFVPFERADGRSIVLVAADGVLQGMIALSDRPRATARDTIALLREQGITHVTMLTGDRDATASAIAEQVGVNDHAAGLTPSQKHAYVERLRATHGPLLMVGDGINDAPALAAADVGVAMGAAGSDAALETADVALMSDELLKVAYVLRLARATLRNVRTNVALSLVLKAVFLILAVSGSATLWMAVLADTGASVVVVGNALRLLRTR